MQKIRDNRSTSLVGFALLLACLSGFYWGQLADNVEANLALIRVATAATTDSDVELAHAEDLLLNMISRRPEDAHLLRGMGVLTRVQGRLEVSEEWFSQALEANASDRMALLLRAQQREVLGDLEGALEDWGRYHGEAYLLERGKQYRADEQYQESVLAFRIATETQPNDCVAWRELGWSAYLSGQEVDFALSSLDHALSLCPDDTVGIVYQGNIALREGDFETARDLYNKAIALDKTDQARAIWALAWLVFKEGEQLAGEGNWEAAKSKYQKALQMRPEFPEANATYGRLLYFVEDDREAAVSVLQHGVLTERHSIFNYVAMGDIFRAEERYLEAIEWYQTAWEVVPEHHTPPALIAFTYAAQGEYGMAVEYSLRSLALKGTAVGHCRIAEYFWGLGELERAAAEARIGLVQDQTLPWCQDVLQAILYDLEK